MNRHIISALVSNKFGVLNRISGLFSKRAFNINSLTVSSTENPDFSRTTIVTTGDDNTVSQIIKQLRKLYDVKHVEELLPTNSVQRELLLVKVRVLPEQRPEIESTIRTYKAKSVDLTCSTQTIELSGESGKIEGLISILEPYGILELARTGVTALSRGEHNISEAEDNK